jgi:hypothetical protein
MNEGAHHPKAKAQYDGELAIHDWIWGTTYRVAIKILDKVHRASEWRLQNSIPRHSSGH